MRADVHKCKIKRPPQKVCLMYGDKFNCNLLHLNGSISSQMNSVYFMFKRSRMKGIFLCEYLYGFYTYRCLFMYHFIRNTNLYYHANSFASNFPKYSCIQNLRTLTLRLLLIFCFKRFFFNCKNPIIFNNSQVNIVWVLLLVHVFDMLNLIDKCNYHEYVFIIIKNYKISQLVVLKKKK